jgi:hypothetical protein
VSSHLSGNRATDPKKNETKPWQRKQWCFSQIGADFVWRMEDALDLYAEPFNPLSPVICFDETYIN